MYVFDACVAAKWLLPEALSDKALALVEAMDDVKAPSLVLAEMNNAIWKRLRRAEISATTAKALSARVPGLFTTIVPIETLSSRAAEIMITLTHPIYDCLYLALAEREGLPIVTVDAAFMEAARRLGTVEVRHLADM